MLPAPASLEVTAPVVLVNNPVLAPVARTFTLNTQVLPFTPGTFPPASVTFIRLIDPDPATACVPPALNPRQRPAIPLGVATTKPEGKLSVNPTPVRADAFGLNTVNCSVAVWPGK